MRLVEIPKFKFIVMAQIETICQYLIFSLYIGPTICKLACMDAIQYVNTHCILFFLRHINYFFNVLHPCLSFFLLHK